MRIKRGTCACLAFWVPDPASELPKGASFLELQPLRPKDKTAATPASPKVSEGLWREVLQQLEIMSESDAASSAGFQSDRDGDESGSDEEVTATRNPENAILPKRFSQAMDQEEKVQLTELELRTVMERIKTDRELPPGTMAITLIEQMRDHLQERANSLDYIPKPEGNGKVIIVGDIHGHLNDLLRLIDHHGQPNEALIYLFNGDFVDRGIWGPEVLLTLYCLRLIHPNSVFLNRGNHETKFCTDRYGFANDLKIAYPEHCNEMYMKIQESFDQLPLCHIIGESVFVAHGGLPAHALTIRDLSTLQRGPFPMQGRTAKIRTIQALLWSDPKDEAGTSARGMGYHFSQDMTDEFLADNGNLQCIVRSHECVGNGFDEKHNGKCKTVFSASNYDADNDASVCVVDSSLKVSRGLSWNEPYMNDDILDAENPALEARNAFVAQEVNDQKAFAMLSNRVQSDQKWKTSPMERAMDEVCQMIFLKRAELLDKFVAADQANGKVKSGQVSHDEWKDILDLVLRTPKEFPWDDLAPWLHKPEDNGNCVYMDFLLRYDSPFSAWLGNQWAEAVLDMITNKSYDFNDFFDKLDAKRTGTLPYSSMRTLLQTVLMTTKAENSTAAMNERIRDFTLFRKLDRDGNGSVDKKEFFLSFFERLPDDARKDNTQKELDGVRCPLDGNKLLLAPPLTRWTACGLTRVCDRCSLDIPATESCWSCPRGHFDMCEHCKEDLRSHIYANYIALRDAEKRITQLQEQWDVLEQGLRAMYKNRSDVHGLFTLVDKKGKDGKPTGKAHHRNFVKHMGRALKRTEKTMAELYSNVCMWVLEEREESGEHGPMLVKELTAGFVVRDRGENYAQEDKNKTQAHGSMMNAKSSKNRSFGGQSFSKGRLSVSGQKSLRQKSLKE